MRILFCLLGASIGGGSGAGEGDMDESLCQLSGAFMTEPVKTPYGNVYDRNALKDWLLFSETDPV